MEARQAGTRMPYSGLYLDVYEKYPFPGGGIDTWYYNGGSNQYFHGIY
jgi:hypothetical protein